MCRRGCGRPSRIVYRHQRIVGAIGGQTGAGKADEDAAGVFDPAGERRPGRRASGRRPHIGDASITEVLLRQISSSIPSHQAIWRFGSRRIRSDTSRAKRAVDIMERREEWLFNWSTDLAAQISPTRAPAEAVVHQEGGAPQRPERSAGHRHAHRVIAQLDGDIERAQGDARGARRQRRSPCHWAIARTRDCHTAVTGAVRAVTVSGSASATHRYGRCPRASLADAADRR